MQATRWFIDWRCAELPAIGWLTAGLLLAAAVLGLALFRERPRHAAMVYSPRLAWLRAGLYFCGVALLATQTGVMAALLAQPPLRAGQLSDPLWLGLTALCVALFAWGYLYWWPRGTLTHGRRLYLLPALLFGLAWGTSSALLLLSVYALLELLQWPAPVTALLAFLLIAIYNMNYQSGWWDLHVSPPHNVRAWNARKVLGAHNPFLLATLAHLVLFGNVLIFVGLYAAAMAASAVAMRLPPFWESDGPAVSVDSALGE